MPLTAQKATRARQAVARICSTAPDISTLLEGIETRLRPVIGYDVAAWLTTDPATMLFTDGLVTGFPLEVCQPWFDNELLVDDVNKFVDLARTTGVASLSSSTDEHHTSARWQDVMQPIGLDAELRGTFGDATGCWATVEFHRTSGDRDFDAEEQALVGSLGGDISGAIRRILLEREARQPEKPDGPGLLMVRPDGSVEAVTEAGATWLDLLMEHPRSPTDYRATSLLALGAYARGGVDRPRRTRTRTRDGQWVVLHASPMTDGSGSSAVIVEPLRPHEIAAVLALAHGLSTRETEVATAIARGESTNDIASSMSISPHTVRDHLKSSFAKVGVSSRTELVARLFADHYADDLHERVKAH